MNKKQILLIAFLACSSSSLIGSSLLLGDLSAPDNGFNGFSFNLISKMAKNHSQEVVYVGSKADLTNAASNIKKYAVSAAASNSTECIGIALETATLNGIANQPNPLHGAQCSTLGMVGSNLAVLTNENAGKLYVVTSAPTSNTCVVISNDDLYSADGEGGASFASDTLNQDTFCGVDPLAFATIFTQDETQGGIGVFRKTTTGLIQQAAVKNDDAVKAVSVWTNSSIFKINNDLGQIDREKINLYWSDRLFRLFVGVQVRAGGDAQDGCISIGAGFIEDDGKNATLTLYPIINSVDNNNYAEAIQGENKIIGARGQNLTAAAYKQTVMFTSTGLTYLIVVGDSLDPLNNNDMQKWCYALPLVNESVDPSKSSSWKTSKKHATLAKKGSLPTTFYKTNANSLSVISARGFQEAATEAADLYDRTDPQVLVGGNDFSINVLETGIIMDVQTHNDTVFILLSGAENGQGNDEPAGVFYSQAIFDANGVIANWTSWQRASCAQSNISGSVVDFAYMPSQGKMFQLQATEGINNGNNVRSVTLNSWSEGSKDGLLGGTFTDESVGLVTLLSEEFPQETGGIYGLFNFNPTFANPFFAQAPDNSIMIATGYKKIGLIFTTMDDIRVTGDFKNHTLRFTEEAIDPEIIVNPFTNVAAFISGGALDDIGAITSAAIITHTDPDDLRYIVVGGTEGIALLRRTDDNKGFDAVLDKGFDGLGTNLAFEIMGDFANVKKLWTAIFNGTQYLFILTLDGLYRVSANSLTTETPTITTLATIESITGLNLASYDFFTDVIVSDKFCLLGTNKGLVRNGNGTNICTATNADDCTWTSVDLIAPYNHVAQLVPLLTSPLPYEFATQDTGQVYALTHSNALTTSTIHCFSIKDISGVAIDDTTCTPVYKETVKDLYAPFMSLGSLRNCIATNGALTLTSSLIQPNRGTQLFSTPVNTTAMIRTVENYPFSEIKLSLPNNAEVIRGILYNTALGSWIAYGNFGIRVCE